MGGGVEVRCGMFNNITHNAAHFISCRISLKKYHRLKFKRFVNKTPSRFSLAEMQYQTQGQTPCPAAQLHRHFQAV